MPLTPRQQRFCQEYIIDRHITNAAIRAGYSKKGARTSGWDCLQLPAVKVEIQRLMADVGARLNTSVERIEKELARIAFADFGELLTKDGGVLAPGDMPEDARRAVSSIHVEELHDGSTGGRLTKLRFWDKLHALELLGKRHGMFVDRAEVKVTGDSESAWARAAVLLAKVTVEEKKS